MPAPAVRTATPPSDLADRSEGWGSFGGIFLYPNYRDTGVWPANVVGHELVDEHTETSDTRDTGWFRSGELIS
jgi:hypothetical protein